MGTIALRRPLALLAFGLVGSSAFVACSGNPPVSTPGLSDAGQDAPATTDGGTCSVPTANGIQCFSDTRCDAVRDVCCVALRGGNTLVGSCIRRGAGALAACQAASAALWECDRAKDCPSAGDRCCVPDLVAIKDRSVCPVVLALDPDAGPPADGKPTRCSQAPCGAGSAVACESDAECNVPGEKCVPVILQNKVFGACLKP